MSNGWMVSDGTTFLDDNPVPAIGGSVVKPAKDGKPYPVVVQTRLAGVLMGKTGGLILHKVTGGTKQGAKSLGDYTQTYRDITLDQTYGSCESRADATAKWAALRVRHLWPCPQAVTNWLNGSGDRAAAHALCRAFVDDMAQMQAAIYDGGPGSTAWTQRWAAMAATFATLDPAELIDGQWLPGLATVRAAGAIHNSSLALEGTYDVHNVAGTNSASFEAGLDHFEAQFGAFAVLP